MCQKKKGGGGYFQELMVSIHQVFKVELQFITKWICCCSSMFHAYISLSFVLGYTRTQLFRDKLHKSETHWNMDVVVDDLLGKCKRKQHQFQWSGQKPSPLGHLHHCLLGSLCSLHCSGLHEKKRKRLQWSLQLTTYNLHTNTQGHKIKMPDKLQLATYITCNIQDMVPYGW